MGRVHKLLTAVMLAVICLAADGARAFADKEDSVRRVLAAGQQAMLERHSAQAVRIFRDGLKDHPERQAAALLSAAASSTGALLAFSKSSNSHFVAADVHAAPRPRAAFAGIEEEENTLRILALAKAA